MITGHSKQCVWYGQGKSLFILEHWLIGQSNSEKQYDYKESRVKWRRDHNVPDKLNVKGANYIPGRFEVNS